ncbi:MAG: serine/threonine-protein kinase [Bdellovibrio sp.]
MTKPLYNMATAKIGKYTLLKSLGEGGMAQVHLARTEGSDVEPRKLLAIKKNLPENQFSQSYKKMFLNEMRVSAALNHRNICRIVDYQAEGLDAYIAMEFIHGVSLRELCRHLRKQKSPLPLSFVFYILREAAEALHYAHEAIDPISGEHLHLIHRDVSPQNIMLSFAGDVKLIDFGIAKAAIDSEATRAGVVKGKYSYMSPEQLAGKGIDPRADIFSLGIVAWEMLANRSFFQAQNVEDLKKSLECYAVRKVDFSYREELESYRSVVEKMIHEDRDKRFTSSREVADEFSKLLAQNTSEMKPEEFGFYLRETFQQSYQDSLQEIEKLLNASSYEETQVTDTLNIEKLVLPQVEHLNRPLRIAGPIYIPSTVPNSIFSLHVPPLLAGALALVMMMGAGFWYVQQRGASAARLIAEANAVVPVMNPSHVNVMVQTHPVKAQVWLNGRQAGVTGHSYRFPYGKSQSMTVKAEGYHPRTLLIHARGDELVNLNLQPVLDKKKKRKAASTSRKNR